MSNFLSITLMGVLVIVWIVREVHRFTKNTYHPYELRRDPTERQWIWFLAGVISYNLVSRIEPRQLRIIGPS